MQWDQIIEFLGGTTVFGAVVAYLGKVAIEAFVSGRVEAYKSELQRASLEHSVRFERLHLERAEAIKDLYAKLVSLDDALTDALRAFIRTGDTSIEERVQRVASSFNDLRDYFHPRRIFFETETCFSVEEILELAKGIFFEITTLETNPTHEQYRFDRELLLERHQFWEKARASHKNEFPQVRAKLEAQFRSLLGVGPNPVFQLPARSK